ncbi:MAG: hypothetical protein ACE5OZ_04075 [Candidatus Heimdallarchaeota archaeon]
MPEKTPSLLIRSERVTSERLQNTCSRLARMIQAYYSGTVSGRIHVLPARRSLEWLKYPPEVVSADIVTAALFGNEWKTIKKIPQIVNPTIVIESYLTSIESETIFKNESETAEILTRELTSILANFDLEVSEAQLTWLSIESPSLDEEMRHIKAAKDVLKRKRLDPFNWLNPLWQNEEFLRELEKAITTELLPDPGGIRHFLADFETEIEDLDARWLLALWRQSSGAQGVDFAPLIRKYQSIYTKDLLERLESMQQIRDVDPMIQQHLSWWHQVAEHELVDSALVSQRIELRQSITDYRFHHHKHNYTAKQIENMILREEQDRNLRRKAWNSLAQLSQQLAPKMRKLLLKTNTYWQERGYANAIAPRLETLGVSEAVVRQAIASIEATTRVAAQLLLKEYESLLGYEITLFDWRFAATQLSRSFDQTFKNISPIDCLKKTYKTLGIDIEQLPIQFAGSPTNHIRCNAVRIPHDIILSHGPISGAREYRTLLMALGKTSYYTHISSDLPYAFRRYAPHVVTEGFARLSSWLLWEDAWLKDNTNLSSDQITEFSQQMRNYELLELRYYAGFAVFEMDAYQNLAEDPKTDLDALYTLHMENFLLMPSDDRSVWAANQDLLDPQGRPYFTNYVMGLAVAAALLEHIHEKGNCLFSNEFGRLFQSDLVRQSTFSPWLERLQQLTARRLTPFPTSWSQAKNK